MRAWLLKHLGGISGELALKQLGDVVTRTQDDIKFLQQQIREKDLEIQRLTDLMLKRSGFITSDVQRQVRDKPLEPINKRKSWTERQHDLEVADANKHAENLKRQWEAKNAGEKREAV